MKIFLVLFLAMSLSGQIFANESKKKSNRKPTQEGQSCVTFSGTGAKKTFMTLYPFTQGRVTAIVAEETRNGETNIATANIFCRVFITGLSKDSGQALLTKLPEDKFQCGYFVSSEGDLTACSDPM